MDDKDRLSRIENYLKELCPGSVIEYAWKFESRKYMFRVAAPSGETQHAIAISEEFVSDNEPEDIVICLKLFNLKAYLDMYGSKEILVTNDGINPEAIRPSLLK
ncbi:MAG: hypothetical protein JRJ12_05290 [Deltaproteobacteria bacterium]|nr:hypothetical protein [Deltaproteobacteria bacterium]MBW2071867.1 hypothetical protein [Deltaproteobacteria bacterium]